MKKLLLILSILISIQVVEAVPTSTFKSNELDKAVEVLLSYDEAKTLWNRALQEGPIKVEGFNTTDPFEAYWEGTTRRICVNLRECNTLERRLTAILFELHNAAANESLRFYHEGAFFGQMNQEEFAMGMERIEWQNVNDSYKLLQRGIKKGHYSKKCFLPYFEDFSSYLEMQERYGHTNHHRGTYNQLRQQYR